MVLLELLALALRGFVRILPFVSLPASFILLGHRACLQLSFLFVVWYVLLFLVRTLASEKLTSKLGIVLDLFLLGFLASIFWYVWTPTTLLYLYGAGLDFSRVFMLAIEGIIYAILCVHLGFWTDLEGDDAAASMSRYFILTIIGVAHSLSAYLLYLVYASPNCGVLIASLSSSACTCLFFILFAVIIIRRFTSCEQVEGNILDASLLLLFISYVVYECMVESNPYQDGVESIIVQKDSWIANLVLRHASSHVSLFISNIFTYLTYNALLSLSVSLGAIVALLIGASSQEQLIQEAEELKSFLTMASWTDLLHLLSILLYTNLLFTLTKNAAFALSLDRVIEYVAAIATYLFLVLFPFISESPY